MYTQSSQILYLYRDIKAIIIHWTLCYAGQPSIEHNPAVIESQICLKLKFVLLRPIKVRVNCIPNHKAVKFLIMYLFLMPINVAYSLRKVTSITVGIILIIILLDSFSMLRKTRVGFRMLTLSSATFSSEVGWVTQPSTYEKHSSGKLFCSCILLCTLVMLSILEHTDPYYVDFGYAS